MEPVTTWSVTGVAATLAFILGNIDSVSKVASLAGIKAFVLLLTASMLSGVLAKLAGVVVGVVLQRFESMGALSANQEWQFLLARKTWPPAELARQLAKPFPWPLSQIMERSAKRGAADPLKADRMLARIFGFQAASNLLHVGLAAVGFVWLAASIQGEGKEESRPLRDESSISSPHPTRNAPSEDVKAK
jgi:hypothetical protein